MATNRRQQIQLSPDEQAAFFRERKKAALATIDKDGFPHVVAMNYVARDGAFYMTSYGKAQKVVNIRRNPRVALMIEAGDEYAELRGVMIRGRCEILDDEASVKAGGPARRSAWCSGSSRRRWSAGTTASSADDTDPPDLSTQCRVPRAHTGQTAGTAVASHRAMLALTSIGFSCAIQWPERITTSDRLRQSRRIGSASREATVSHV